MQVYLCTKHDSKLSGSTMLSGLKRTAGDAGVGVVLKMNEGRMYVKSMQKGGPAYDSSVVKVRPSLAQPCFNVTHLVVWTFQPG